MRRRLLAFVLGAAAALAPLERQFLAAASPGVRRAFEKFGRLDPPSMDEDARRLRLEFAAFRQVATAREATASAEAAWAQQDLLEDGDVYALEPCGLEASEIVAKVRREGRGGVALAPGVVDAAAAERLRVRVLRLRDAAAANTQRQTVLGDILCPRDDGAPRDARWDVFLDPSDAEVAAVVDSLLAGPVGEAFQQLCGADAPLRECSAVVAAPGAPPQPIHADTTWTDEPVLFTCFVALQPVEPINGPTRFLPNTATAEEHERLQGLLGADDPAAAAAELFAGRVSQLALLDAGDATLYDSRLHHAGGPCFGDEERVLFYVSFGPARCATPPQASIAPAVAERGLKLGDMRRREKGLAGAKKWRVSAPRGFLNVHSDPSDPWRMDNVVDMLDHGLVIAGVESGGWVRHDLGWSIRVYEGHEFLVPLEEDNV